MRITVDDEEFEVRQQLGRAGSYDYTWLTGPNPGYGFSGGWSDESPATPTDHAESIRNFLEQVDPTTGYIE